MVTIESRHIMDKIREDCPLKLQGSLERITLLPPESSNKSFGVARFETSEGEKEVTCAWWVSVMPEFSELVIRWIGTERVFSVEL